MAKHRTAMARKLTAAHRTASRLSSRPLRRKVLHRTRLTALTARRLMAHRCKLRQHLPQLNKLTPRTGLPLQPGAVVA